MSSQYAALEENLSRLNDLNKVMKKMAELERIPVSEACRSLADFMNANADPLLYVAHASGSPYLTKGKSKKRFICC